MERSRIAFLINPENNTVISDAIARLAELRAERLAKQKLLDKMKEEEDTLLLMIHEQMRDTGKTMYSTILGTVELKQRQKFVVQDWPAFYSFIVDHQCPFLLEKRPAAGAINEFYQEGKRVDGVNRQIVEVPWFTAA